MTRKLSPASVRPKWARSGPRARRAGQYISTAGRPPRPCIPALLFSSYGLLLSLQEITVPLPGADHTNRDRAAAARGSTRIPRCSARFAHPRVHPTTQVWWLAWPSRKELTLFPGAAEPCHAPLG